MHDIGFSPYVETSLPKFDTFLGNFLLLSAHSTIHPQCLKDKSVSMSKREQLKDDYLENRLIRRRLVLAAVFSIVLLSVVLGRLYVLQIVEHEHFSTLSDSNRIRIKALPPTRGLIYDRHGVVMADNLPAYRLEIVRE